MNSQINVIVPVALKDVMNVLAPRFEEETTYQLNMDYMLNPEVPDFIANGADWDLAMTNPWYINNIVAAGHTQANSHKLLGFSPLAFARKANNAVSIISDIKKIERMLSQVESIAITGVGTSGDMFRNLAKKLGVWESVKGAIRPMAGGDPIKALVAGDVEVAALPLSNIISIPEVVTVAVCPEELEVHIDLAFCLNPLSNNPAQVLAQWLSSPTQDSMLEKLGVKRML